ncbi:Serine/threonine-protein kinase PITSLRE, partial [Pseudolycoriella hygida]
MVVLLSAIISIEMDRRNKGGDDDDQSEDGQLRSPYDGNDSNYDVDTTDSLEIKPPQAGRSEHRYKEKKSSRDKKHSRTERRHKERDRNRERDFQIDRRHGHRNERTDRRHQRMQQQSPYQRYEVHPRDKEHYRMVHKDSREVEKRPNDYERRKEILEKSEAERKLEDLRSRLLIKRNKYADAEKRIMEEQTEIEYRSEHREVYRYDHHSGKREKEVSRKEYKHKSRKSVIELIDSPENVEMEQPIKYKEDKHRQTEDPELIARRARILEADREMAKRKESAREELEARRELRREQKESNPIDSPVAKKRRMSDDSEPEVKQKTKDDESVDISDNSDDTVSDTETNSNTDDSDEQENSEEELPTSPLSVGDLSKSDRRRRKSQSRSLSRSHSTSRTPSRSPRLRNRSRSSTPTSDFEKDKNPDQPVESVEAKPVAEEVKVQLPNYFPGIQGCRSVEEFQCLNRIEEGTYGVVYRARDKRTEEIVALKRLKMEKEKEGFPITALREINTLLKGQHPNIVTVREIVVGSNMDKIFIVMDYVEHDLKSLMETMKHRKQVFLPAEVKCLTQQLLRAVAHLHDNWILHRDLKTSNLLLSHKGILKVGDFGLAREYGSPLKAYTSIVVTLWYRAPELLLCCKEYSIPIDMWSVGCIFAELLSMSALFPGKSEVDQLNRIFKDLGTPNEKIWPGYGELPAVQKMTFAEYPVSNLRKKFAHLTSELGLSLLQGLLTYDPKQRLTADQGLKSSYFKELPLPIDPAMFPTWPAKSELGARKALASSPKPPSGGGQFKQLVENDDNRFMLNAMDSRQLAMGPGF